MASEAGPNPFLLPPVVKAVFKFLPAKSLCSAARVCSLWRGHAQRCLQQRQQYSWQYFEQDGSVTILEMMQQYFQEVAFKPTVVTAFMTRDQWDFMGRSPAPHSQKRRHGDCASRTVWKRFCETVLPSSCQVFCSVTSGIVGTTSNLSLTTEKDVGRCVSFLCFGQYPGLHVSLNSQALKPCNSLKKEDIEETEGDDEEVGENDEVKLLLLMCCLTGASCALEGIHRELPRTLIVGGVIETSYLHGVSFDNSRRWTSPYCVTFRGGADVQVACVKLDSEVSQEDKAEGVIQRLKAKTRTFNLRRSLAFMFACVARGYHLYSRHNIETSLFRRHFPTTPLLGLFGNGEIGCEFPRPEGEGVGKAMDMQHAYTTFIAVISLP